MGTKNKPADSEDPAQKLSISLPLSLIQGMDERRKKFRPKMKRSAYVQKLIAADTEEEAK